MNVESKLDLYLINEESAYQKWFAKRLKEFGKMIGKKDIKNPAELSKPEKIKFFNIVDKEWKGKDEKD